MAMMCPMSGKVMSHAGNWSSSICPLIRTSPGLRLDCGDNRHHWELYVSVVAPPGVLPRPLQPGRRSDVVTLSTRHSETTTQKPRRFLSCYISSFWCVFFGSVHWNRVFSLCLFCDFVFLMNASLCCISFNILRIGWLVDLSVGDKRQYWQKQLTRLRCGLGWWVGHLSSGNCIRYGNPDLPW